MRITVCGRPLFSFWWHRIGVVDAVGKRHLSLGQRGQQLEFGQLALHGIDLEQQQPSFRQEATQLLSQLANITLLDGLYGVQFGRQL